MPPPASRAQSRRLTVAVTGPTGTFGHGLMPLLEAEPRIGRVIGIARRPFDPAAEGWSKLEYRQGDVRDGDALREAFVGADVVVHLAFMITGNASRETIRAINVDGTLNAFRAAAEAGAKRFVYASSVAAYGFHRDNPIGMTEEWPVRPATRLFYAQEKAEIEHLLADEADRHSDLGLYLLRPPIVLGRHSVGAKEMLPGPVEPLGRALWSLLARMPVGPPVPVPGMPIQFIHEADVGQAFLLCILGSGPPGAYNIAADEAMSAREVARAIGLTPLPVPGGPVRTLARALSALPAPSVMPAATDWVEALSHPAIMDTSKARSQLGWRPRFSARDALRETLRD